MQDSGVLGEIEQKELGDNDVVRDATEKLKVIKARMRDAPDRQKSYSNKE
jgi:hypothetical protein